MCHVQAGSWSRETSVKNYNLKLATVAVPL
uniref:Uncharacterized protein n=1 Tax=Anguilla anguilla TaxID=7936 RepID=A0A0E9T0B2_ANGAN